MSDKDLFGLGLAVAGGFLLGKTLKSDDDEEIKYLKKERRRLMSERDDVIEELEIATQEDYVSPEDRYEEEYEEDEDEDDTEDDVDVQQRSAMERLALQNPSKYPKHYDFEDEILEYRSAELGEQELLDMMYAHFENISTVIQILRRNDVDEDDLMDEEIMDYLTSK